MYLCEGLPLVEFLYLVSTRMPGGVTVGESDLFLLCAVISLCLLREYVHKIEVGGKGRV